MHIIGIDPGGQHCGYAVLEVNGTESYLLASGELNLDAKAGCTAMRTLLATWGASGCLGVACEIEHFVAGHNRSTVLGLRIRRGQDNVRGRIREMAEAAGLKYLPPVNVSTAKTAMTGHGCASKQQMTRMARLRWGVELSEHAADAAAVALAAVRRRHPTYRV